MSKVYKHLRNMLTLADAIGKVTDVTVGEWITTSDRAYITGKTNDGHGFTLTLEIEKEANEDVV